MSAMEIKRIQHLFPFEEKYVILVFASFRKFFICRSTLPKILLFKSERYMRMNEKMLNHST